MAGLNGGNGANGGDGTSGGGGSVPRAAEPMIPVDARAVRVRLGPASRLADEAPMRVSPAARPLRMTNPTVGTGPLGGVAVPHDGLHARGSAPAAAGASPVTLPAVDTVDKRPLADGTPLDATIRATGRARYVLDEAGSRTRIVMEAPAPGEGGTIRREVLVDGFRFEVEVESERIAALRERAARGRGTGAHGGPLQVKAIIPGKVVSVSVAPGDAVTAGQQLLVVEAMKMQNELRSPRDGTIEKVGVAPGVNIEVGDLLIVIS